MSGRNVLSLVLVLSTDAYVVVCTLCNCETQNDESTPRALARSESPARPTPRTPAHAEVEAVPSVRIQNTERPPPAFTLRRTGRSRARTKAARKPRRAAPAPTIRGGLGGGSARLPGVDPIRHPIAPYLPGANLLTYLLTKDHSRGRSLSPRDSRPSRPRPRPSPSPGPLSMSPSPSPPGLSAP